VAIILWATAILTSPINAQGQTQGDIRQSGITLTGDSLKQMLVGLGYEPTKLTTGYLTSITKDGWTFHLHFVLSSDQTKIGINTYLGPIDQLGNVTAAEWLGLLEANREIDPSAFYVDKDQKALCMHRVVDNRSITPAYLRQQTDNFCTNLRSTSDSWQFVRK
jgi:hypothetical protein